MFTLIKDYNRLRFEEDKEMKNIHKKNKYISLIMTMIVLFTTVLNNADNIFGADGTKLTITVVDAKGEVVNDAVISSEQIISIDDTDKDRGVYELSVNTLVGEIKITDKSAEVNVSVDYDANETLVYKAVLKKEWGFNIENDDNVTLDHGKYNISTYFYSENGEYKLYPNIDSSYDWKNTEFEVSQDKIPCHDKLCNDSECNGGSNTITDIDFDADDSEKYCSIKYNFLGNSKIIIKPISKYYENVEIDFNVKNKVQFNNHSFEQNQNIEKVIEDDNTVSKITKKLTKEESLKSKDTDSSKICMYIKAEALFDDIIYEVDNDCIIKAEEGNCFYINKIGSAKVRAISKKTGDSAECIIDIKGHSGEIEFNNDNKIITDLTIDLADYNENVAAHIVEASIKDGLSDKYEGIEYESSDSSIVDVEKGTGDVTVKKAGTVTITAKASPKDEYAYLDKAVGSYTLVVKPIELSLEIENIITGERHRKNELIGTVSDESEYFSYDINGNGSNFELPFRIFANGIETTDVSIKAKGLNIEYMDGGFIVTNPDSIERNMPIDIAITTKFSGTKYINITEIYKLIVSGEKNNNEENKYYTVEGNFSTGADGNRWCRKNPGYIRFIGQNEEVKYLLAEKWNGSFKEEFNPGLTENTKTAKKEVKFYIRDVLNRTIIQREYFGIDCNAPIVSELSITQGNVTSHGIYSNDNVKFSVKVIDNETNLYDVSLFYGEDISFYDAETDEEGQAYINGNVVPETVDMDKAIETKQIYMAASEKFENCKEYTTEFVIGKELFNDKKEKDFVVLVRDKAGNCNAVHIGQVSTENGKYPVKSNSGNSQANANDEESKTTNILYVLVEDNRPQGKFIFDEATRVYVKDGINYIKDNTKLTISLTDIRGNDDISGIASYRLIVNGKEYINIKNNIVDEIFRNENVLIAEDEKISEKAFELDTSKFSINENKELFIQLVDIYDNAGNKGEDKSVRICVDNIRVDVKLEEINAKDRANVTEFGNFFNEQVILTFKVADKYSGVKSVKLKVDNIWIEGVLNNKGIVSFALPVGSAGKVSLAVLNNVGNEFVYTLVETCQESNNTSDNDMVKNVKNNYILIERTKSNVHIKEERTPDSLNKWYNHAVKFNVSVNDKLESISSNIKTVEIYINDSLYKREEYNDNSHSKYSCNVVLGNNEIAQYMNNDGSYIIKAVAIDNAGNEATEERKVYMDNVAPVIESIYGVEENSHNAGIVTLFVKVNEKHWNEAGNKAYIDVEKTLDGVITKETIYGQAANSEQNTYVYTFKADGTYKVTANSIDAANNKAVTKTINFTVDNTAPIVDITGVLENSYYKDVVNAVINVVESNYKSNNVSIEVTKELLGKRTVLTTKEFLSTAKNSKLDLRFDEEGTYTIKAKAVDEAKNTSITRTVVFTVDSEAPTIKISGVKDKGAYKDEIIPKVEISDNYYKSYNIKLTKTGVYFGDSNIDINSMKDVDVTKDFITNIVSVERGIEGSFDSFEKKQVNDGVYTLTVTAYDYAGRVSTQVVNFSVNRFGSVYTFNESLKNMMNVYAKEVTGDFVITEYNADEILDDSIRVEIARDGTPITFDSNTSNISITKKGRDETGWYQNIYTIPKENFALDGIYSVTVSSTDIAGNRSQSIVYDQFDVRFSIDNTKPELVKVTGLNKNAYNANQIEVTYEVFDSIGIKEVRVYVNDENIQTINEFEDLTVYEGTFMIGEGVEQQIRFEVEDMAGNVVDSSNKADIEAGKVADFTAKITVTTNALIRWYSNKLLFISSIVGMICLITVGTIFTVCKRKKVK